MSPNPPKTVLDSIVDHHQQLVFEGRLAVSLARDGQHWGARLEVYDADDLLLWRSEWFDVTDGHTLVFQGVSVYLPCLGDPLGIKGMIR